MAVKMSTSEHKITEVVRIVLSALTPWAAISYIDVMYAVSVSALICFQLHEIVSKS